MWILIAIWTLGSIALGLLEYQAEREYKTGKNEAIGRALLVTLFWWAFRAYDAWQAYR